MTSYCRLRRHMIHMQPLTQSSVERTIDIDFQWSDRWLGKHQIQRRHTRVSRKRNDRVLPGNILCIPTWVVTDCRILPHRNRMNEQIIQAFRCTRIRARRTDHRPIVRRPRDADAIQHRHNRAWYVHRICATHLTRPGETETALAYWPSAYLPIVPGCRASNHPYPL